MLYSLKKRHWWDSHWLAETFPGVSHHSGKPSVLMSTLWQHFFFFLASLVVRCLWGSAGQGCYLNFWKPVQSLALLMQKVEIYLLVLGAVGTKKKSLSNVLLNNVKDKKERYQVDMQSYPSTIHLQVTNKKNNGWSCGTNKKVESHMAVSCLINKR